MSPRLQVGDSPQLAQTFDEVVDCDVVIVGCGVAGLYCALSLPEALSVVLLSKEAVDHCDSMLAQGGICVLHDPGDYEGFFEDTLRAGHYENRLESVDLMIRASRPIIDDLIKRGVRFARRPDGELDYTREGAHSRPRIVYHEDVTGEEITTRLLACVRDLPHARILEHTCMTDILEGFEGGGRRVCRGVVATGPDGESLEIRADATVFATGGVGGLYSRSTNFSCLTGDGCRIAAEHGILLEHMDYVQIHPTSLWSERPGRAFLISESARGEGAILLNDAGERFTDELQPRDVVSAAIFSEMRRTGAEHVWLSFERVPRAVIEGHFTHILERCLEEGYDIREFPPSTTSWVASMWTRTPRPPCRTSLPAVRPAATASTARTGWPRTACSSRSSLPSGRPTRSCATALPRTPRRSWPLLPVRAPALWRARAT